MFMNFLCLLLLLCFSDAVKNKGNFSGNNETASWNCDNNCTKTNKNGLSFETCNMVCMDPPLWPKPNKITIKNKGYSSFTKNQILLKLKAPEQIKKTLRNISSIFMDIIPHVDDPWLEEGETDIFYVYLNVKDKENKLTLTTDEAYYLSVIRENFNIVVNISAANYFGARHAIETLSQLIWKDSFTNKLNILHNIEITDFPQFPYRGLMIDTSRNYFQIHQLIKVVDGMAASKLNVLHLHLTDHASFPISLPSLEKMAETGAYGETMIYTPDQIKTLREYAELRGIRLVLEVDAPSHVNEGWHFSEESLIMCGESDNFNGHLNPDNIQSLNTLEVIYKDLLKLSDQNEIFHIGGDEVNADCWSNTKMAKQYTEVQESVAHYINKMIDRLTIANNKETPKKIVLWSSPLTDRYAHYLNYTNNIVVQFWLGTPLNFLQQGLSIIYSTVGKWYLDCGFGPWRSNQYHGVCDPYTPWQTFYEYRPWYEYSAYRQQTLGGEACLWSEQVEGDDLETRIWPRAAALAERLWSDPEESININVFRRISLHRERLISRGVKSAAIWPRWCTQNPHRC